MLCGNRSLLATAEWGRTHEAWCVATFGFPRRTPCINTFHRVLKGLDVASFEAALRAWLVPQIDAPVPLESRVRSQRLEFLGSVAHFLMP